MSQLGNIDIGISNLLTSPPPQQNASGAQLLLKLDNGIWENNGDYAIHDLNLISIQNIKSLIFINSFSKIIGVYNMDELKARILQYNNTYEEFSVDACASYIGIDGDSIVIRTIQFCLQKYQSESVKIEFPFLDGIKPISQNILMYGENSIQYSHTRNLKYLYAV